MASSFDKLKELNLSRDEVERIGEALKKPEFRKLLSDYVEELQDPVNKKLYEEEVIQLEKERGIDVTFIHPKPGYVIKTSVNGNQKGFINICANEHVKKPSSSPTVKEGAKGLSWALPHTLSPPREDIDNRGARCQVFDIVFHPDALHLSEKNKAFRTMVNNTALDAVESNFDVKLDKKNLKFPKLSYKGLPHSSVIKKPSETKPEHTSEEKEFYDKIFSHFPSNVPESPSRKNKTQSRKNICDDNSNYTTPKYVIKHRSHVDLQEFTEHKEAKIHAAIPKELVIEINLPLLKSSGDITLDVSEKTVQLVSEMPAKYKLNLTLPYQVIESSGNAKFNKDAKTLIITLPVQRNISCGDYSDSGVESDHGSPCMPESEEEPCEKHLISDLEHSEKCIEKSSEFRTSFLEENLHYNIPEFTCYVFENTIAFTLNVKNVDEKSVSKIFYTGNSVHVKFTSIGSSFYPSHYAFCVRLPMHSIDEANTTVEVWDNNVVLQVPVHCDNLKDICLRSYFYGSHSDDLSEKYVEEPEIINQILNERREEGDVQTEPKEGSEHRDTSSDNQVSVDSNKECNPDSDFHKPPETGPETNQQTKAIDIVSTSYESSGDELSCSSYSPRKCKGILKRLSSKQYGVGRSISESSLDDFMCSSSFENCLLSLDPEIPEDGEISTSLKKTVRFSDVIKRQMFRSNSSILGQKKKNQRKARNKKRALERRHSESEASEIEEKKEGELKDCEKQAKVGKKEENYIFDLDIDN